MLDVLNHPTAGRLGSRLKAWWNGEELEANNSNSESREQHTGETEDENFPSPSGVAEWTPQRIASIQCLYGEGVDSPSAAERVRHLINPVGLNEQMTVLEIGARLGTAARLIAKETGAWVDGLEPNEALVEEAMRLSAMEGLTKKAVVRDMKLNDPEIQEHKRDAIIARECLYQMEDREGLFKSLVKLLKPSSHLLVSEFLIVPSKGKEERAAWNALHSEAPLLFELNDIRGAMKNVAFDVRIAKDETKAYKAMLLNDIRQFGETIQKKTLPRELQEWVMWEVEYWARTFDVLNAGGITLHRIHAVSPPEDPTKT